MIILFKLSSYGNHLGLFIFVIPIILFTLIMSSMVSNRHREHDSLVLLCSYTYAHGFTCSRADYSMLVYRMTTDMTILFFYMDNIILTASSSLF